MSTGRWRGLGGRWLMNRLGDTTLRDWAWMESHQRSPDHLVPLARWLLYPPSTAPRTADLLPAPIFME